MKSRTNQQVRRHAEQYFKKLAAEREKNSGQVDTSSVLEDEYPLPQPQSGYPAHLVDPLPSEAKTLYKCPACDRTNLSKHGLAGE